jgi:hypothetical protein
VQAENEAPYMFPKVFPYYGVIMRGKSEVGGRSHGLSLVEQQELGLMNSAANKHKILDFLIAQNHPRI